MRNKYQIDQFVCWFSNKCMAPQTIYWNLRCWIQGDNACKEVRNSYTGRWASLMCQANFFSVCGHHHMVVGHTHEDIGSRVVFQNHGFHVSKRVTVPQSASTANKNFVILIWFFLGTTLVQLPAPLRWYFLNRDFCVEFPDGPADPS